MRYLLLRKACVERSYQLIISRLHYIDITELHDSVNCVADASPRQ